MPDDLPSGKGPPWIRIPAAIMDGPAYYKLSGRDVRALHAICAWLPRDSWTTRPVGLRLLAQRCKISSGHMSAAINRLVDAGLIVKHRQIGRGRRNSYTVKNRSTPAQVSGSATEKTLSDSGAYDPRKRPNSSRESARNPSKEVPDLGARTGNRTAEQDNAPAVVLLAEWGIGAAERLAAKRHLACYTIDELRRLRREALAQSGKHWRPRLVAMIRARDQPPPRPPTREEVWAQEQAEFKQREQKREEERLQAVTPEQRRAVLDKHRRRPRPSDESAD